ncbi:MAG TPA: hypothetical protein VG164_15040 [Trebonia sp.]|nr:hypothetical protein [Trebonia sp.]
MRSGWPHTQDDRGAQPAGQRQAAFGPEISWPTRNSGSEYQDGDYRYPAQAGAQPYAAQPPAASAAPGGEHPYAAFGSVAYGAESGGYPAASMDDFGYGDPGYSNPGYQGPASQDAGVAGTRTVRGFVESGRGDVGYGQQPGYGAPAAPAMLSAPVAPAAPPAPRPDAYQATEIYREPWDYDQPLRYDGEEPAYPGLERSNLEGYGATAYNPPAYDPGDYNGSDYSMPGVNGPGYDLSGIIHTGEFPEIGFDQPGYDRLAYDDPRYDMQGRETRFDMPALGGGPENHTRFDMPALGGFDETRLDHVWPAEEGMPAGGLGGYGDDGFGGVAGERSGYLDGSQVGAGSFFGDPRETRLDLGTGVGEPRMSQTRFDMPALDGFHDGARFDETRIDGLRALAPATQFRRAGTTLLAPPEDQPLSWADETSLDTLGDFDQAAPAAFTRTLEREAPGEQADDTAARRAIGKRRGRSGDKRQWMALGAIAVVAAGAIGAVLMKFSGPSGPAHSVSAPGKVSSFTREPNLEQQMKVGQLAQETVKTTSGQASDVVSAVYQQGSSAPGSNPQIFMFVGGKLANSDPSASITNFEQNYRGATAVSPAMGGKAACAEATSGGESVSMCVWFDNDTFGELVSPTMNTAHLAQTLNTVRPNLEHTAQ